MLNYDAKKIRIEDLDLPNRLYHVLKRANINYVSELLEMKDYEFYMIDGIGSKSIDDIKKACMDYSNKMDVPNVKSKYDYDVFVDENDVVRYDKKITINDFNPYVVNQFNKYNYTYFSQIKDLSIDDIERIGIIRDRESVKAVIEKTKLCALRDRSVDANTYELIKNITLDIFGDICEYDDTFYYMVEQAYLESKDLDIKSVCNNLKNNSIVCIKSLSHKINRNIVNKIYGVTISELTKYIPSLLVDDDFVNKLITYAVNSNIIIKTHLGLYVSYRNHFNEIFIKQSKDKIDFYNLYSIKSLYELNKGQYLNSKEVKSIRKELKDLPTLYEDMYNHLFSYYSVSEDQFKSIFNESKESYIYLLNKYTTSFKANSLRPIEKAVDDFSLPVEFKTVIKNYIGETKPIDVLEKLAKCLEDDFYSYYEIANIYHINIGSEEFNLTSNDIKELGYSDYNGYVVKSKYHTDNEYFDNLLLRDEVDLDDIKPSITNTSNFTTRIYELTKELKLLKVGKRKFISFYYMNKLGFSDSKVEEFINELNNIQVDRFFTIKSLSFSNLNNTLLKNKYSDYILSHLFENKHLYNLVSINEVSIFTKGVPFTFNDFLEYIVMNSDNRSMKLVELVNTLNDKYGISISSDMLNQYLSKTMLYFDKTTNMIYENKEIYQRMN